MNKKFSLNRKAVIVFLLATIFIMVTLITVISVHEDYFNKIMVRVGLKENDNIIGPDYWALKSWTSCLENLNLDVDVVFLGDSITRGSKFQNYFSNIRICNLGYSGDTISGLNNRIDMVLTVKPEKIFILAGINDLFGGASSDTISNRYSKLIAKLKDQLPDSTLYIQSIRSCPVLFAI